MNSSRGFTREELEALTPWRLPVIERNHELDEAAEDADSDMRARVMDEEVAPLLMPTAEEIEAMQKQAYEEAADQGRMDGLVQGRELGYQEGYAEGREQGYAEGKQQAEQLIVHLKQVMNTLETPLQEVDAQVEQELVALAIAVARQLIRRELRTDPGQIIAVVREAMAILPSGARKVSLFLHPDDAELIRAALSVEEEGQAWKLVEDPLLTRGGCRVTSETSTIDATVEKRLSSVIAKALGGERGGDSA